MNDFIIDMSMPKSASVVGGKAAVLMALAEQGFNVPSFFVITPDAFESSGLKKEAKTELNAALSALESHKFAVRSSGREEDGVRHSHAGQFLTVLNVNASNVARSAIDVFKSAEAEHLSKYRKQKGLSTSENDLAVLVQVMVNPHSAGVAFTADPVSGRQDRLIISAVKGLADSLVNGEVNGETYVVQTPSNTIIESPDTPLLSSANLDDLAKMSAKITQYYSHPQDIEWAFSGDELFLLQSRPITSTLRPPPLIDTAKIVFDNSNIIESYPGLVSPLTFSFAQYSYARVYRQFVSLLGVKPNIVRENSAVFDNMLSRINGRVYYNLLNWYRALALLPGFSINRDHMEVMMGVDEPLPVEISSTIGPKPSTGFARLREYLSLTRVLFRLIKEAVAMRWTRARFMRRLNRALARSEEDLDKLPLSALAAEYRKIEAQVLDQWDAPLINDFLCMFAFGGSRKLMEKWAGQAGLTAHNDILIGQGNIISAEPAQRIRKMGGLIEGHDALKSSLALGDGTLLEQHPELKKQVQAYLAKFKDRCTEELKLESITLDRDPAPLYMAISAAADNNTKLHTPNNSSSDQPLNVAFKGKPIRKVLIKPVLNWAKRRVRDRENLRFERTRIFGRARNILRAIAKQFYAHGLLDDPEDIFFLTVQEILGGVEGFALSPDFKPIIALRKTAFEHDKTLPERGSRFIIDGAMVSGISSADISPPPPVSNAQIQTGTGCSAGIVTAPVKIITDPKTQRLKKGEILVAKNTDPGWIAVFSNASALIVERGSLLSHSAIVARELGIPCVVALKGAMSWLEDGETVTVDGSSGEVRRKNA